jgi:hypothetical protein
MDGRQRNYLSAGLSNRLLHLAEAALKATRSWMFYLKGCDPDIGKPQ